MSIAGIGGQAAAQAPQLFPVEPKFVPLVVAATFILPAMLAGSLSLLKRLARSPGAIAAVTLLIGALVAAAYAGPGLFAGLRG